MANFRVDAAYTNLIIAKFGEASLIRLSIGYNRPSRANSANGRVCPSCTLQGLPMQFLISSKTSRGALGHTGAYHSKPCIQFRTIQYS